MDKKNAQMKRWGFREGTAFEGLIPRLMERVGDDVCTGESDVLVEAYDPTANGSDPMKVISSQLIAEQ